MNAITTHEEFFLDAILKVVIIYDDFNFAARATALLERAAVRADKTVKWDVKPWRLGVLQESSLAAAAAAEAGDADLILLALNEIHSTPGELLDWLEHWAENRKIRDAAVMLLCLKENAASALLESQLERFAKLRELAFLSGRNFRDGEDSTRFIRRTPPPERFAAAVVAPIADWSRPAQHWGINE